MTRIAIRAEKLGKRFGSKTALAKIDLEISKGSIHAILGPNGAGKTTFIKILSTLLTPSTGRALVLEHDVEKAPNKIKQLISLAGQNASVDEELTGYENLVLIARLLGLDAPLARKRAGELLRFFLLRDAQNRLVKNYSGGMRRRLDIAASIVKTPEILFLDEPTTGLDPRSRNSLWQVIRRIAQSGTTVVLSTQYLDEADQLADQITVIDSGRIVTNGTPDQLKASVGQNMLHLTFDNTDDNFVQRANETVSSIVTGHSTTVVSGQTIVTASVPDSSVSVALLKALEAVEIRPRSFSLSRPTLDEVFLALTDPPAEHAETLPAATENQRKNATVTVTPSLDSVIAERHHPHRANVVVDSMMLGWRSLLKVKHIPEQFMDVLITPVMFTFMFAFLLGGALAGSVEQYLAFLVPGMLVQTITFNSIYSGITINTDISKGIFDRFKTLPIWSASPFFGLFVGDCLRHVISGVFLLLFSMVIGFRLQTGVHFVLLALVLIILFALSLSWLFVILGLVMRSLSAVMSTGWMLLMPLVFMSNIYAEPATMPQWLQTFIAWNPVSWQVDTARMLFRGEMDATILLKSVMSSLVISAFLAPAAVQFYRRER